MPATIRTYMTGLALALVLTIIPFAAVAFGWLPTGPLAILIATAAIVQVLVHFRWFLHIDLRHTEPDRLAMLAFAAVLLFIMIGGTLWVMFDLNMRMM